MTIWFDVEDLLRFFQIAKRPTGIQRLSFEVCAAASALSQAGVQVGFCRRNPSGKGLLQVDFTALQTRLRALEAQTHAPSSAGQPRKVSRVVKIGRHVPMVYRLPLREIYVSLIGVLRGSMGLLRAVVSGANKPMPGLDARNSPPITLKPGDWLVHLGASWEQPYAATFLDDVSQSGVRLGLFIHDLIPDLFPEWCTPLMVADFSHWLDEIVPRADKVFALSTNTLHDLGVSLAKRNQRTPMPVLVPAGNQAGQAYPLQPRLLDEAYVLMVGTIEARKNHAGMMRVWRQLLNNPPAQGVPTLVFAGKAGWLTADLMQQLENAGYMGGKIKHIDQPSEAQLASLYQHCLFTLYPSLYEGWGLPVTESLCFGKTVVASNTSSIPEAGGSFCRYFNPENLIEAGRVIRDLLDHPAHVTQLEAEIKAQFAPPSWSDTAATLLTSLAPPTAPDLLPHSPSRHP